MLSHLPTPLSYEVDTIGIYIFTDKVSEAQKGLVTYPKSQTSIQTQTIWPWAWDTSGTDSSCRPVVSTVCIFPAVPNLCGRAFKFRSLQELLLPPPSAGSTPVNITEILWHGLQSFPHSVTSNLDLRAVKTILMGLLLRGKLKWSLWGDCRILVPAFQFQIGLEKRTVLEARSAKLGKLCSLPLFKKYGHCSKNLFLISSLLHVTGNWSLP